MMDVAAGLARTLRRRWGATGQGPLFVDGPDSDFRRSALPQDDLWPRPGHPQDGAAHPLPPARRERLEILRPLLDEAPAGTTLDLPLITRLTCGYEREPLDRLVDEIGRLARSAGRAAAMGDVAVALEQVGYETPHQALLEPDNRSLVAYDLAGRTIQASLVIGQSPPSTISIFDGVDRPTDWLLHHPGAPAPTADRGQWIRLLDVMLAGPVAREWIGSGSWLRISERDVRLLMLATSILSRQEVAMEVPQPARPPDAHSPPSPPATAPMDADPLALSELSQGVWDLLAARTEQVRRSLKAADPLLDQLAMLLMEEETIEPAALKPLFRDYIR